MCGKEFKTITNTHLKKEHNMTSGEYLKLYPKCKINWNKGLTKEKDKRMLDLSEKIKNSYTEELITKRKLDALKQMQDPKQIEIRSGPQLNKRKTLAELVHTTKDARTKLKRQLILEFGNKCQVCGAEGVKLNLHHKDGRSWINTRENGMLVCGKCHGELHKSFRKTWSTENFLACLLQSCGIDLTDKNWIDTPIRFAKVLHQFIEGYSNEELEKIFKSSFPSNLDGMVIVENIPVFGLCPHHLLPVIMRVWVGYIPDGQVLGVSKFRRIVKMMAQKPSLQEQLTVEIADVIMKYLKPQGVMVVIKAQHLCMAMRGVEQPDARVATSAVRGNFERPDTRKEFMDIISLKDEV